MTMVSKLNLYPQPNISSVRNNLAVFNSVIAGRIFNILSSLQERIDDAGQLLNGHTRTLLDHLLGLEVAAESAGLAKVVAHWLSIKADGELTEAQRESGCEQVKGLYLKRLRRLTKTVDQTQSSIGPLLDEVRVFNLDHYADPLISFDRVRLQEFETAGMRLKAEFDQLTEDMRLLQQAIALLEGSWRNHVKAVIPTAAEIELLVSTAAVGRADAQLIMAVLERAEKYVNFFETGRKFSSLTTARTRIYTQLGSKTQELKDNRKEIELLNRRAEKFMYYSELLEARTQWVATFSSVSEGVQQFSRICALMSSATDEAIRQTPEQLADFLAFVRPLKL